MSEKLFDFKKTLSSRAYTLGVCWRWKKIDEELFGSKEYNKRSVEQIQESENARMKMHQTAIEELTKIYDFTNQEAIKMLQEECERLIKEDIRELKGDEYWCGCCREIIKIDNRKKHNDNNKLLHDYLYKELSTLSKQQTLMMLQMAKDSPKKNTKEKVKRILERRKK